MASSGEPEPLLNSTGEATSSRRRRSFGDSVLSPSDTDTDIDTDSNAFIQSTSFHSRIAMLWTRRLIVMLLLASLMLIVLAFGHHHHHKSSSSASSAQESNAKRSSPPRLIVYHEYLWRPYCGLDPDKNATWPTIPPLSAPFNATYSILAVDGMIRHGSTFFSNGQSCWFGQQESEEYHCSLTHMSVPSLARDTDAHEPRLFRKTYMKGGTGFAGSCHVGQLLAKGYDQEKALGSIFAKAYVPSLLHPELDPNEVFIRSDDVPHTFMSAQAFVQGMFPLEYDQSRGQKVVEVHTSEVGRETELSSGHHCPGLIEQTAKAKSSLEYLKILEDVEEPLITRVSSMLRFEEDAFDGAALRRSFDCMRVAFCNGWKAPQGFDDKLLQKMNDHEVSSFQYLLSYPDRAAGAKLTAGPLLREIFQRFTGFASAEKGPKRPKFYLYSGHGTGPIMLLLGALGVPIKERAPYASYISLELYSHTQKAEEYAVRMIYNGEVVHIPGCKQELCALEDFKETLQPLIPTQEECPDLFR